jgi:hypothetical protein
MQALGPDPPRQRDDRVLVEITARALADLVRFVGEPGEQRSTRQAISPRLAMRTLANMSRLRESLV